jgi:hypothetical protein
MHVPGMSNTREQHNLGRAWEDLEECALRLLFGQPWLMREPQMPKPRDQLLYSPALLERRVRKIGEIGAGIAISMPTNFIWRRSRPVLRSEDAHKQSANL